ncbi:isopropylmalate isomerase [Tropicibacter sp. S64]|uniref:isopropylmalate isomerase n=1 Tax=Tropicibacter sp. S64 TaxID=3415122 RepID=UPI003C7B8B4A
MEIFGASALFACISTDWAAGVGGPSLIGWFSAYTLAAVISLRAGAVRKRDRTFWLAIGAFLLLLAANKVLDLQTALTAAGRCLTRSQGWYDARRTVQFGFMLALVGVALLIMTVMVHRMRRALHRVGLALIGVALLLIFVATRAAGFHHVDLLFGFASRTMPTKWGLEFTGMLLIATNAVFAIRGRRRQRLHGQSTQRRDMPFSRS